MRIPKNTQQKALPGSIAGHMSAQATRQFPGTHSIILSIYIHTRQCPKQKTTTIHSFDDMCVVLEPTYKWGVDSDGVCEIKKKMRKNKSHTNCAVAKRLGNCNYSVYSSDMVNLCWHLHGVCVCVGIPFMLLRIHRETYRDSTLTHKHGNMIASEVLLLFSFHPEEFALRN